MPFCALLTGPCAASPGCVSEQSALGPDHSSGHCVQFRIYAVICLLGVVASTATALLLKADRALVRDGLYGFNGCLVALALVAFTSADFQAGAWPSPAMAVYLLCGAAFSTMAFAAIATLMAPYKVAPLTMPFVLVGWLLLFAILKFDAIDAGPMAKPVSRNNSPTQRPICSRHGIWGSEQRSGRSSSDNWITGYIILCAIAVNSRISAMMGLLGAGTGALVAALFGDRKAPFATGCSAIMLRLPQWPWAASFSC